MSPGGFHARLGHIESTTREGGDLMSASHSNRAAISPRNDWRELAMREGDGLEVHLLWSRSADRVKVTVADSRSEAGFEFDVASADALSAFRHPFAYASSESFGSVELGRETLDLQTQA
jgi:hypothetical protein